MSGVLAFLCLAAMPAFPAVKSSGTVEIYDDLAAGTAGSVDLVGGNIALSGSLGQTASASAGLGGTEAESGYFSRYVSTPAAFAVNSVYSSSASVTGAGGIPNPSGTLYEVLTSSAQDFSGAAVVFSSTGWPAPLTGLVGNTTYYTRLRASYLGADQTAYQPTSSFQTLPATPTPQGFTGVFSSSLAVAWSATSNSPETQYFAQAGPDPGFTSGVFTMTAGSSHTFTGLSPNTTYFVRLKAFGSMGDETAYVQFGSTITTAVTPSTTVPCLAGAFSVVGYWGDAGNPAGTRYLLQYSTDSFATVQGSSLTLNLGGSFFGLTPNVTHYLRVASLNAAGSPSQFAALPVVMTAVAPPLKQADTFTARDGFSVAFQWLANGNPAGTEYFAEFSEAADFSVLAGTAGWSAGVSVTAEGLNPLTLYHFRVKARNAAGAESAYEELGSTSTLAGVDISSPTITDNQAGDMAWRSSNTAVYNVDLADTGGSALDRLQVRASTGAAGTGILDFDWSDAVTNINANSYSANWGLTSAQWALLQPGTNYISVRVYDGVGFYRDLQDAFYVLKDTAAPVIADRQNGEFAWRRDDPGAVYAVDFADQSDASGLAAVEYSASNAAGTANANVLAWTALPGLTPGTTYYNGPWALNFGGLAAAATNYISVRARDLAGNVAVVTDAFLVLKNSGGPEVRFTAPNAGFHSALAAVSGTAAQVLEYAITGTELTIQDKGSNLYWDGAAFLSVSQVWLKASGLNSWTYDTSGIGWAPGTQYQVVARSSDTALNYSLPYATATFTFDNVVPTAFVSAPAAGATVETPALIAGTAADASPNSGVPYIGLTLRRALDLKWWNFFTGAWTASAVSTMTAGGAAWNFYPDGALRGNLQNGVTYYVYAAARDGALPANESPAGLYASTFTVSDTVPPGTIAVSSAAKGLLPGRLLVTWTAPGDDGAYGTLSDNCWFAVNYSTWAGAVFSTASAQVALSTSGVTPGTTQMQLISGLSPGVTYYARIWTMDEAGNWSAPSAPVSARAGLSLADSIAGNVWTPSGQGVTGVIVEAIDRNLAVVKTAYTVDDGSGSFTLSGLDDGLYRIQATWIENGFASSVASDQIPTGYAEVRFELSVDYQLASVGGELAAYRLSALGRRTLAAGAPAVVELYQRNRLVAAAPVGAGGRFLINNLLPGDYTLKVPDGAGGSKLLKVSLAPGQDLRVNPLGELLSSAEVYAYPNPARRLVTFRIKSDQLPVLKQATVFDLTGRPIKEFRDGDFRDCSLAACTSAKSDGFEAEWHIPSGVASGVYLYSSQVKMTVSGETKNIVKKFAIVR